MGALYDLIKKAKQLDSVIVRHAPIRLYGLIPPNVIRTTFKALIPLQFGINLKKIKTIPTSVSDILREFTTDELEFIVKMAPVPTFSFEGGVRLVLGTQPDPIRLSMISVFEPNVFSIGARMRNLLELKFIALGNAGLQLDFDTVLMPLAISLGVPFTGIGIYGEIDLGKHKDDRVILKVDGGARIAGAKLPDLVLKAEARNLDFANIVHLLSKVAAKSGVSREIPAGKIPIMYIESVKGYVVLEDTRIAGKQYSAGFGLTLDAQLFDKKFGFAFDIKHKLLSGSGSAYMPPIHFKDKGKKIFSITGITHEGPMVSCKLGLSTPAALRDSTFSLEGVLEVPAIDLDTKVEMTVGASIFETDIEVGYAGFTSVFGVTLEPNNLRDMNIRIGFKDDFQRFLSVQAKPALIELQQHATVKLVEVDTKIKSLSDEMNVLRGAVKRSTQDEIAKTKQTIARIEQSIISLEGECARAPKKQSIICAKAKAKIAAQKTMLTIQNTYLKGLLEPGAKIATASADAVQKATQAIGEAQIFRKSVTIALDGIIKAIDVIGKGRSIFRITQAIGEINAQDIMDGKTPTLKNFDAEVTIPGMQPFNIELTEVQFDFKSPIDSGVTLAKELLGGIRLIV